MNEGACDPDGRFYCGSMAYDRAPGAGSVHRLDPDGSVEVVVEGTTISNGLDWNPEGSLAYFNDPETLRVDVFDYDRDRGLTDRRAFVEIPPGVGRPDGLTVDSEGGVWVALNHGGAVHRYRSDGELDVVVEVPVRQVTACTFGGLDLDQLGSDTAPLRSSAATFAFSLVSSMSPTVKTTRCWFSAAHCGLKVPLSPAAMAVTTKIADHLREILGLERDWRVVIIGAGKIGAASTDAVHGGQVFASLQSTADVIGGGTVVDARGQLIGTVFPVQGSYYGNIGDALGALDVALTGLDGRVADLEQEVSGHGAASATVAAAFPDSSPRKSGGIHWRVSTTSSVMVAMKVAPRCVCKAANNASARARRLGMLICSVLLSGLISRAAPLSAQDQLYGEVVPASAETRPGLFDVHQVEDRILFEIPDSLLGRDMIIMSRMARTQEGFSQGGAHMSPKRYSIARWIGSRGDRTPGAAAECTAVPGAPANQRSPSSHQSWIDTRCPRASPTTPWRRSETPSRSFR